MRENIKSTHKELVPSTSLGERFLPLSRNKVEEVPFKGMPKADNINMDSLSFTSSSQSSSSSHIVPKRLSPSKNSSKLKNKKPSAPTSESELEDEKNPKIQNKGKSEITKEVKNLSSSIAKNKKITLSDNVPDDLRAQFELAVNKVRAYIEKEYIDKMCEIDTENAIKLQKELNRILQSERDALEREKYNFEKRLREDMEKEMHAIIEVAAIENKKKADVSLAEMRKDIESHYLLRQKEVEKELLDRKKSLDDELEKRKKELEEEFNTKKNEYLKTILERKKELEEDYDGRKSETERLFNEKLSSMEKQFEENFKIKLDAELAKYNTKHQNNIIEKEKEYLQGKVLVNSLKEQLETMTSQKNELEKMSTTTIDSMKSYIKDLQESNEIQRNQITTMERTIKAMYSKEQETVELVSKANEKLANMIEIKEAKRIAYNSLLKGKGLQMLDETLRNHYKISYVKKAFDTMKRLISRPKAIPTDGDGKGLKGQDLTLFLLRKEQLALLAENENLMSEVENLKSKQIEELRKTQESFIKYRKEVERGANEETNTALFETSMFIFANIFNSKIKLQVLDAFLRIVINSTRHTEKSDDPKKETVPKQSNTSNRNKEFIYLLNSLSYHSKIKLFSYCWRKLVFQTKLTPLKTLPTTPFKDSTGKSGNIDSFYMRDFINSIGRDGSVMSFAHQPNYYNKLPSVINVQNKAVFVPLRRENPITYGTYFKYNKELLSESCVTGRPIGSFTNSIIN